MKRPTNIIELKQSNQEALDVAYNKGFHDGVLSVRKETPLETLTRLHRGVQ